MVGGGGSGIRAFGLRVWVPAAAAAAAVVAAAAAAAV